MRHITISFVFIVVFTLLSSVALAGGPWKGQVRDIETKEPIEGVVIVAFWNRVWRTPAGGVSDVHEVKEVSTDMKGKFEMPAYTPINVLPIISYMKGPEFIIFKPGYGSLQMGLGKYLTGETGIEPYSGKLKLSGYMIKVSPGVIEIQKLKTRAERIKASRVGVTGYRSKDLPLLYKALNEEQRYLGIPESE